MGKAGRVIKNPNEGNYQPICRTTNVKLNVVIGLR